MAYSLYHVQMANAWKERVNKEDLRAEQASAVAAMLAKDRAALTDSSDARTTVTTKTGVTAALRTRVSSLEEELKTERSRREEMERVVEELKKSASGESP
ncbi:hypothetical protein NFJ02_08g137060 [Pycnococcus provasolii]